MWYCVISVLDFDLKYLGMDSDAAKSATDADSVCAKAERMGDAQVEAAKLAASRSPMCGPRTGKYARRKADD